MNRLRNFWLFIIFLSVFIFVYFECPLRDEGIIFKDEKLTVHIPSPIAAQLSITTDTIDNFFDKITIADIELQMKTTLQISQKQNYKNVYREFLKSNILKFKNAEVRALKRITNEIFKKLESKISIALPNEIEIVKITDNIYGANVFFTRNKTIFLTEQFFSLVYSERKKLLAHELSHVISRNSATYKKALYPTIGFKQLKYFKITYDSVLQRKILINPDGANDEWFFEGNENASLNQQLLNVHLPTLLKKDTVASDYFSNIDFKLLTPQVKQENTAGLPEIVLTISSPTSENYYTDYFNKNFGVTYTIHPDEIIAELFVQWLLDEKEVAEPGNLKSQTFRVFSNYFNGTFD